MFDLIQDAVERPYREGSPGATIASMFAHVAVVTSVAALPLFYGMSRLPTVQPMMAFVAMPSSPPPAPPPPLLPAQRPTASRPVDVSSSANPHAAPIEAPAEIALESPSPVEDAGPTGDVDGGTEGGTKGGVVGGVLGGLLIQVPAPPPPPAPPPSPPQPVRIGGAVIAPALVHRVAPVYPAIAVSAHIEGVVILEASVDTDGRVRDVKVVKSREILDQAAIEAVKQWRYAPLTLNGVPTPFVLTVSLNFSFK